MPKIVDHEQYRKELLAKAFEVFAQYGYAAVSMRQIAEATGVTTGTLYHYFPDKQALFDALVAEMSQRDLQRAAVEMSDRHTLQQRIEAGFRFMAANEDYFLNQLLLLLEFRKHHQTEEHLPASLQTANATFRKAIADVTGSDDPRLITLVCAIIDGLLIERFLGQPDASLAEQADLLAAIAAAYQERTARS